MARGYGQFCPIAKAAEVICDRWTPLVLRELMNGSRYFNEIAAGVPLMSRSLLAQRLRELQDAGILAAAPKLTGRRRASPLLFLAGPRFRWIEAGWKLRLRCAAGNIDLRLRETRHTAQIRAADLCQVQIGAREVRALQIQAIQAGA